MLILLLVAFITKFASQFLYRGIAWSIPKRYRDFEELNRKLILENEIHNIDLPILPKKRWFEKQRWLNRFDESYGIKRRHDLQVYMRCLAKMQIIRENSPAFRDFIAMPPEAAKIQREEFQRQASGEISPPKDRKLEYRDSMLEVDLNLEFDDEGNAICPVDPYQERSHEIEDREHQIYSIGEEEHEHEHDHDRDLSPIPPEEGETDSDDEKGGEEGNEPAMESEPVGGEADNEQQREEQRSRLQAVDGRQDVDRGADGVDSSSASTAPSIAAATTSSPKGSAHSHDMTLKLQSLHSHY